MNNASNKAYISKNFIERYTAERQKLTSDQKPIS